MINLARNNDRNRKILTGEKLSQVIQFNRNVTIYNSCQRMRQP